MRSCRKTNGFTIVEAILAMTILAVAAGGVLLPFAAGANVQAEAERQMLAARLAADVMEDVLAQGYAGITAAYCAGLTSEIKRADGTVFTGDAIYSDFTRKVEYYDGIPLPLAGIKKIHVYVYYKGQLKADLVTLVCRD